MNRRDRDALDRHITGNWGEDQLDCFCVSCGRKFRPEERTDLHEDVDLANVDTCSPACDSEESYRLLAEHEGEGVPLRQTERECLENGGWIKEKKRKPQTP